MCATNSDFPFLSRSTLVGRIRSLISFPQSNVGQIPDERKPVQRTGKRSARRTEGWALFLPDPSTPSLALLSLFYPLPLPASGEAIIKHIPDMENQPPAKDALCPTMYIVYVSNSTWSPSMTAAVGGCHSPPVLCSHPAPRRNRPMPSTWHFAGLRSMNPACRQTISCIPGRHC